MGRPTEKRKNKAVGLRISEDLWGFLAAEDGNVSEKIREILESYVKQNGSFVKQNNSFVIQKKGFVKQKNDSFVKQNENNVKQNSQIEIPDAVYKDFLSMAKCFGMTYEDLMCDIDFLMNEGFLYIDGKRLHSMDSRLNTEAFFKKCEELGCKDREQAVLDKLVKGMVKK